MDVFLRFAPSGQLGRWLLAAAVALLSLATPAAAGWLDVSPWLSQSLVSSKRSLDPLIDYTVFPWPIAYIHTIERTDRFTNTSDDTTLTLTGAAALGLDPEDFGVADLTPANAPAVEAAALAAHGNYSLWAVEDLPFAVPRAAWGTPYLRPVDAVGSTINFPVTLQPRQSLLLDTRIVTIGQIGDMGELVLGWQFDGTTSPWSAPLMGDVNADGRVDVTDFGLLKANWGSTSADWFHGDLDGDGQVSLGDFGLLKQAFGKSAAAVPEPSSAILAFAGLAGLTCFGRRYARR
ncbi:MAG: dockerin type I repeat-containing protein [Pirellulales bacterium]